jgi:NAD(P)-dependent dehydrogenase (short-subunit alcohol dehydrogenase family)
MPSVNFDFTGQIALVTGAGSGIGRACAEAFARSGAGVVVSDADERSGTETASAIREAGGNAVFIPADVSRATDVRLLIENTLSAFGRLDIAHNNAGISSPAVPMADVDEQDFDRVIAVNLKSVWLCMKHEIPVMLRVGGGAIVNTCSALGLVGSALGTAYVAAKHGVAGLTKTAALEYSPHGIRVNAVCPGIIRTQLLKSALSAPESERQLLALHPIGRLGEPQDVVGAVLWLASAAAGFVTGTLLTVDGGWTAS